MPPETMQLRSQLLNASPYLSDTVMVNAAKKEAVLPNSIVTEILTENPQSAKEYLTIEYEVPFNIKDAVIEIISITGVQKEAVRLKNGWGQKIVDLRTFNPGTYFVRLYLDGKVSETKKFVKF